MTDNNTCGNCFHFLKYHGEARGQCYANPPTPTASGSNLRPTVRDNDKACSSHVEGTPMTKEKGGKIAPALPATKRSYVKTVKTSFEPESLTDL